MKCASYRIDGNVQVSLACILKRNMRSNVVYWQLIDLQLHMHHGAVCAC